ncbi:Hypothetical predicted protein, partial [Olea europaea subsp. europaea]
SHCQLPRDLLPKKWLEEQAQASSKAHQGVGHLYGKRENHLPTKRCNARTTKARV